MLAAASSCRRQHQFSHHQQSIIDVVVVCSSARAGPAKQEGSARAASHGSSLPGRPPLSLRGGQQHNTRPSPRTGTPPAAQLCEPQPSISEPVDTEMIPPPSPTPAPHPPTTFCCGLLRGGGSVCARTYQRRPRNTGAATGILPISLSGETTRRTNFLPLPAHRNVHGGAQSDPNAPASRAATATYNTVSHHARMVATTPSTTPVQHCLGAANNKERGCGRHRETGR